MAKAIIIGGGIIGLSSAHFLRKSGWEVTVLEKSDLTDNCSFGNMGYLSPSHIVPLAAPGMISQGILWMFDKKSPFYVRPVLNWQMIDWGLKFMRHCTTAHVEKSARPLVDLLLLSKEIFQEWAHSEPMNFDLREQGCLMYFATAKKEKEEMEAAKLALEHGMQVDILDRAGVHALEPDLLPEVNGGAWYRQDAHLDPSALMQQMPAWLEKNGVKIIRNAAVTGFKKTEKKINAVQYQQNGNITEDSADLIVLAAGSWSPQLARMAGEHIPLMPGKGYSTTISGVQKQLHYPCIFLEAKVALTPWNNRLRIGSTMEIGPINNRILLPRVQGILEAVPRFMPGYLDDPAFRGVYERVKNAPNGESLRDIIWQGLRPVSADGLPYIGFAPHTDNLLIATGHAMLGLSMGPGTGKLVAEMAEGRPTSMDTEAFRAGR